MVRPLWWQILLAIWLFLFGLGYFVSPELVHATARTLVMGGLPISAAVCLIFGK